MKCLIRDTKCLGLCNKYNPKIRGILDTYNCVNFIHSRIEEEKALSKGDAELIIL
jgi:hypothetical protein